MHHAIHFALLLGIIAGLRAFTTPAAVSWALRLGWLVIPGKQSIWLGNSIAVFLFTALALFELINDQNPKTPSRLVPAQFIPRVLLGAGSGLYVGWGLGWLWQGALAGAIGAVIGTLGGAWVRGKLASAFGKDLYAGLLEDAVAVLGAILLITHL